jgi:hypothetical protein
MPEPRRAAAEYHDEYSETLVMEYRKLEDALLGDTVSIVATSEPIRLRRRRSSATHSTQCWRRTASRSSW